MDLDFVLINDAHVVLGAYLLSNFKVREADV
jgi:hypothetical protein